MRVTRFALFLFAVSGMSLALAFFTPRTPGSTDAWILGLGAAAAVVAAGVAVWVTENPLASVALLPLAFASAVAGNYLPYLIGLWDLHVDDFPLADFLVGIAFLSLGTIAAGLILGLVVETAHLAISSRLSRQHDQQ